MICKFVYVSISGSRSTFRNKRIKFVLSAKSAANSRPSHVDTSVYVYMHSQHKYVSMFLCKHPGRQSGIAFISHECVNICIYVRVGNMYV